MLATGGTTTALGAAGADGAATALDAGGAARCTSVSGAGDVAVAGVAGPPAAGVVDATVGAARGGAGAFAGAVAHADNASAPAASRPCAITRKAACSGAGDNGNDLQAAANTSNETMNGGADPGRRWLDASGVAAQDWPVGASSRQWRC
ncbi:MAG: hypothetical protein U5L03_15210 [Burkholderiaceae bacterium]|nr:hypothetical protein [Burkholderiaceae bacterium]